MNKGSHGDRAKEIWWSSETAQRLRRYVETDRRRCDPTGAGLDDSLDSAPLFVTDEGTDYDYPAFYYHWQNACAKTGLKIHPHQARHWFVTMALRYFQAVPEEGQREAHRRALISYMSWKNSKTIQAYDHHIQRAEFAATHAALTQLVEGQSIDDWSKSSMAVSHSDAITLAPEMSDRLKRLLDST